MPLADPFYYLANFRAMIDTLQTRDGDLLEADERQFILEFRQLPQCAQALLVRLAMRKGPLFRSSRLLYAEIGPVAAAMAPLRELGWVDDRPHLSLEELFELLTRLEAALHLAPPGRRSGLSKAALLEALRAQFPTPRTFDQWCETSTDRIYRLTIDGLCARLSRMFFGNFRQNLTDFVLADLGIFRYESIVLTAGSRPFATRRQVDDFHRLHRCRELLDGGADLSAIERVMPSPVMDCEWLEERRQKVLFRIARAHERAGAMRDAARLYANCTYPEAPERARRLQDAANGRARRRAPTKSSSAPEFVLVIDKPAVAVSVERAVRDHLQASSERETAVHYVENGLINSLFGLLCWPAVFAPVPGAFFHRFHHGPADLSSGRFVERRQPEFARCFAELRSGAYRQTIRGRFSEQAGIASPFVAWGLLNERLLDDALRCFPAEHLEHWFAWILRDVRANRSGFPDLVQFWPDSARYQLIEVKGPGDRLQNNQRRCLEFCRERGMPVSVCHARFANRRPTP